MKIGDLVLVGGPCRGNPALVIAVAHKESEVRVRFLRDSRIRWLAREALELLNEHR